jgi:hypothetical protein
MWNAAIVLLSCALLLAACAGVNGDYPEQVAMGDYWDTRLSFMQQIDVATFAVTTCTSSMRVPASWCT